MKKSIIYVLVLSMLMALVPSVVTFADDIPLVELRPHERPEREVLEVAAVIYDNPGIAAYKFEVEYDPKLFTVGDYEFNEYFESNGMANFNETEEGRIVISWMNTTNFTDNLEMFKIYFRLREDENDNNDEAEETVKEMPKDYEIKLKCDEHNIVAEDLSYVTIETSGVIKGNPGAVPTADPLDIDIENPFIDVADEAWFYKYVMYCLAHELFFGVSDNEFDPQTQMTRAMFVTVLYRLAGNNEQAKNTTAFDDVDIKSWYGPSVYWALEKNLVTGVADKKYAPEDLITREQMMVIIYNFYEGEPSDYKLTFNDTNKISSWARDAVRFCVSREIISGRDGNLLAPTEGLTRAEAAKMFFTVATTLNNTEEEPPRIEDDTDTEPSEERPQRSGSSSSSSSSSGSSSSSEPPSPPSGDPPSGPPSGDPPSGPPPGDPPQGPPPGNPPQ